METLYRLKNHVIGFDKEKGYITFIKDVNVESIIINKKDEDYNFTFNNKKYNKNNVKVKKIKYNPQGLMLQIEYETEDRYVLLKEIIRYISRTTLERYFIIRPRFEGKLKEFNICLSGIKFDKEFEVILPLERKFVYDDFEKIVMKKAPIDSSGVIIINNKENKENLTMWYYNEQGTDIELHKNKNLDLTYKIGINKELEKKQEIIIGGQYIKFYDENYLESIEEIEKFYRPTEKTIAEKKYKNKKGLLAYKYNSNVIDKKIGDILEDLYMKKMKKNEFYRFFEIENAILPLRYVNKEYDFYGKYKLFSEQLFENSRLFMLNLGNLSKKMKKNLILGVKCIKLNKGRNYFKYILINDSGIGYIRQSGEEFILVIQNITAITKNINIELEEEFLKENLKNESYILKNLITNKVERILKNIKNFELEFKQFETKILKFEVILQENYLGDYYKFNKNENDFYFENSFFNMFFQKEKLGYLVDREENLIISDIKFNYKYEDTIFYKNKTVYKYQNLKVTYFYDETNKIKIKFEPEKNLKKLKLELKLGEMKYYWLDKNICKSEIKLSELETVKFVGKNLVNLKLDSRNFDKKKIKIGKDYLKLEFSSEIIKKKIVEIELDII